MRSTVHGAKDGLLQVAWACTLGWELGVASWCRPSRLPSPPLPCPPPLIPPQAAHVHVEDPADLQDGLGGSNLEHMHPTKQRVWVLLGGDGPQRTQSLQAGLHAYLRCGGAGLGGVVVRWGGFRRAGAQTQLVPREQSVRAFPAVGLQLTHHPATRPMRCSLRQHPELLVEAYLLEPNGAGTKCALLLLLLLGWCCWAGGAAPVAAPSVHELRTSGFQRQPCKVVYAPMLIPNYHRLHYPPCSLWPPLLRREVERRQRCLERRLELRKMGFEEDWIEEVRGWGRVTSALVPAAAVILDAARCCTVARREGCAGRQRQADTLVRRS